PALAEQPEPVPRDLRIHREAAPGRGARASRPVAAQVGHREARDLARWRSAGGSCGPRRIDQPRDVLHVGSLVVREPLGKYIVDGPLAAARGTVHSSSRQIRGKGADLLWLLREYGQDLVDRR